MLMTTEPYSPAVTLAATTFDPASALVNFGVLGVVLLLLLMGWLWAKPSVDRLLKDYDRVVEQRDYWIKVVSTDVIPLLSSTKDQTLPALARIEAALARRNP